MTKNEIILHLKSLINDAESHMMADEPKDSIFRQDKKALQEAIEIIKEAK